jgi:hypothetical protein
LADGFILFSNSIDICKSLMARSCLPEVFHERRNLHCLHWCLALSEANKGIKEGVDGSISLSGTELNLTIMWLALWGRYLKKDHCSSEDSSVCSESQGSRQGLHGML